MTDVVAQREWQDTALTGLHVLPGPEQMTLP